MQRVKLLECAASYGMMGHLSPHTVCDMPQRLVACIAAHIVVAPSVIKGWPHASKGTDSMAPFVLYLSILLHLVRYPEMCCSMLTASGSSDNEDITLLLCSSEGLCSRQSDFGMTLHGCTYSCHPYRPAAEG